MAIDFPSSPTPGQVFQGYYWDNDKQAWRSQTPATGAVVTSTTTPTGANNGDLWYNTNDGTLYIYFDNGITAYWTEVKANSALTTTLGTRLTAVETGKANLSGGNTFTGYQISTDRPSFWVWINTASSSVASGGNFPYNATVFNIGNNYSTSTYRFTAPVAGLYHFGADLAADDGAMFTGKIATFYKNGTYYRDIFEGETGNASHWETHASTSMNLVAGDYVTVTMRSGAVTLPNGQDGPAFRNSFYGYLVG